MLTLCSHRIQQLRRIKNLLSISFFAFLFLANKSTFAQCSFPVNMFPYSQDFENTDGGWTRSSSLHWEW